LGKAGGWGFNPHEIVVNEGRPRSYGSAIQAERLPDLCKDDRTSWHRLGFYSTSILSRKRMLCV